MSPTSSPVAHSYAKPMPPLVDGKAWDGLTDATINGVVFHADKRTVKTAGVVNRRQWASTASELTGPALAEGATANVLGWANGKEVDVQRRWWIGDSGSRLWVGGTVEKPTEAKPDDAPDAIENGSVVLNGVLFYPVGEKGSGRVVKVIADANKRRWAGIESPSLGLIPAGTDVTATYWCIGEAVDGEKVWWVLGADLNTAPRMWVGVTDSRPR